MWPVFPFDDVLEDVTGGNVKTLQSDYLVDGKFPIIDQGQKLIGGYTDDVERLCKAGLPVVVFGDHTKSLKYVDFPFCLGADGTKILKPKLQADPRYLYYFLQTVQIPDAGYSRHFKYLRKAEIPLPPLEEQKRIAAILDQADALRRLRARALDRLNALGQAVFHEMFENVKTSLREGRGELLADFVSVRSGYAFKSDDFSECGDPVIRISNIEGEQVNIASATRISKDKLGKGEKFLVKNGDLLIAMSGATTGKTGIVTGLNGPAYLNQRVGKYTIEDKERVSGLFLSHLVRTAEYQKHVLGAAWGAAQPNVSGQQLVDLRLELPPLGVQDEFGRRIQQLVLTKNCASAQKGSIEQLFISLQHRAFRGEL